LKPKKKAKKAAKRRTAAKRAPLAKKKSSTRKASPPPVPAKYAKSQHPAMQYARDVVSGKIPASKLVIRSCQRHLQDLADVLTGKRRDIWFDEAAAQHTIDFFQFLRHSKGEWAGQPLKLEPWQQFILWVVFGWKRSDGTRRFRSVYVEVPRKNGKSTLLAGVALYGLVADGEPGAEIYTAATKRDQAKIIWDEAVRMRNASPALKERIAANAKNLNIPATASKFEPLGKDQDSLDGLNSHMNVVDEVHAHKTREVWDVLETGMGARRQPLQIGITTAGSDKTTICWELHEFGQRVLDGMAQGDSFFAYIAGLDDEDLEGDEAGEVPYWATEAAWRKANPNYGVSVKPDNLRELANKAREAPAAKATFLQKRLDVWVKSTSAWINTEKWAQCGAISFDEAELQGLRGYGGLDLSTTEDITAFVAVFPPRSEGDVWHVAWRFWVPEERILVAKSQDKVPYDLWEDMGYLKSTPGNMVDYDVVREDIKTFGDEFIVPEIGFDPFNATQLATQLDGDGFTMVKLTQSYANMSEPSKFLEGLINTSLLAHGNNPVANFHAGNVSVKRDAYDNIRPIKSADRTKRIDGIVALVMAINRAMAGMHIEDSQAAVDLI
jgi:phage terminase large subunit-like protein